MAATKPTKRPPALDRMIFRLYPNQAKLIDTAMGIVPDAHLGRSHFAREAFLRWAAQVVGEQSLEPRKAG